MNLTSDHEIFCDFVDANFDSQLEEECISALERTLSAITELVGSPATLALVQKMESDAYRAGYSERDALKILEELDDSNEVSDVINRLWSVPDLSLTLQRLSLNLKMYAMIGVIDTWSSKEDALKDIEELVHSAELLTSTLFDAKTEPFMVFFTKAARARLDLDLGKDPEVEAFASLVNVARHPHSESVGPKVLDLPIKTIQNLISAGTLVRSGEGRVEHQGAYKWILKQWAHDELFPSCMTLSSREVLDDRKIEDPVFVPIIKGTRSTPGEAFLPEHRHDDGYRFELNGARDVEECYWEALKLFQCNPGVKVGTKHGSIYAPLSGEWQVVEKQIIVKMIENEVGRRPDEEATITTRIARAVQRHDRFNVNRVGHSSKLFRFKCVNGEELALEKVVGKPKLYIAATSQNLERFKDHIVDRRGPSRDGRHHHLNTMDGFKGREVAILRPETLEAAKALIDLLASPPND